MSRARRFSEPADATAYAELERFESAFSKLEGELAHRKGVSDPRALAAAIGDKKIGKEEMARRSAASRERHEKG